MSFGCSSRGKVLSLTLLIPLTSSLPIVELIIQTQKTMKIVYCTNRIYKMGGLEIITIVKANALAEIPGNQVWIALADNSYSTIKRLKKVSVLDLAVHYYAEDNQGYWHAIMDLQKKRKYHRLRLEQMLNDINPDVVISTGMAAKRFIPKLKIKSNPIFIMELHSSRHLNMHLAQRWRDKIMSKMGEFYDNVFVLKKYDRIVVLTEAEKTGAWKHFNNISVMPNPLVSQIPDCSTCETKIAITAGRFEWVKNFESLINIWAKVTLRHPEWVLQLWGQGPDEEKLRAQIERMGMQGHIFIMGYTSEMQKRMSEASVFVLASRSEGFSLTTIEAMSVGIPTVVYNCPGGIRYVVKDGVTGFLVPLNDENAYVEAICKLIENEELRKKMGQAALKEAEKYRLDGIISRWMDLFQELLDKKRGQRNDDLV